MNTRFASICIKAQEQKMAEKLNNFEKLERKKKPALFLTQTPPDGWHLANQNEVSGLRTRLKFDFFFQNFQNCSIFQPFLFLCLFVK